MASSGSQFFPVQDATSVTKEAELAELGKAKTSIFAANELEVGRHEQVMSLQTGLQNASSISSKEAGSNRYKYKKRMQKVRAERKTRAT